MYVSVAVVVASAVLQGNNATARRWRQSFCCGFSDNELVVSHLASELTHTLEHSRCTRAREEGGGSVLGLNCHFFVCTLCTRWALMRPCLCFFVRRWKKRVRTLWRQTNKLSERERPCCSSGLNLLCLGSSDDRSTNTNAKSVSVLASLVYCCVYLSVDVSHLEWGTENWSFVV